MTDDTDLELARQIVGEYRRQKRQAPVGEGARTTAADAVRNRYARQIVRSTKLGLVPITPDLLRRYDIAETLFMRMLKRDIAKVQRIVEQYA